MFDGVTRFKNRTYSSEWNWVISRSVAGLARWQGSKLGLDTITKFGEHLALTKISIFLYRP